MLGLEEDVAARVVSYFVQGFVGGLGAGMQWVVAVCRAVQQVFMAQVCWVVYCLLRRDTSK